MKVRTQRHSRLLWDSEKKVKKITILSAGRGKTAQKSPSQGRNCIHLKDYAGGSGTRVQNSSAAGRDAYSR